jgi:D-alanyl-D-alanine-carboxypeptidase/D-alanyl-D-alanine-endopeptidase
MGNVLKAIFRRGDFSLDAPRMEDMVEAKVDPATYDALVGKYGLRQGPIMTVTREERRLFAQMAFGSTNVGQTNAGPNFEIFPKSELQFFWKDLNANVTFVKDKKGTVTKVIFYQSGETLEGTKIANTNPASYDALLGKYDYGEGIAMTVTREGNQLFAQLTGQPKSEILPASETEFFWKDVDAQVTFVTNEAGHVTRAVHKQGGRTLEAPRIE